MKHNESGKSKAKRFFVGVMIATLVIMSAVPLGSYVGQMIAGSHQTPELKTETTPTYIFNGTGAGIPYATTNGTTSLTMPVNETTLYVELNVTVEELNSISAQKLVITDNSKDKGNYTLGFGTSEKNFTPEAIFLNANLTTFNMTIQPYYLTGNQTQHLIIKETSNQTAYAFTFTLYGNNGLITYVGPVTGQNIAYVFAIVLTALLCFIIFPWHDISINPNPMHYYKGRKQYNNQQPQQRYNRKKPYYQQYGRRRY